MPQVTVNFGIANSITKDVPEGTTIGDILGDANYKTLLGFGANVVGKIDGVTQSNSTALVDGDELDLEVQANTKA